MRSRVLLAPNVFSAVLLLVAIACAATSASTPNSDRPLAPDRVIASLNQTLAWYREARGAMRAAGVVFAQEDEQTALRVLERAFDAARAQATVLALEKGSATETQQAEGQRAAKREQVTAALQSDQQEIERLQQHLRTAPAAQRQVVQDEVAAATNRLELDRARLDFLTGLEQLESSSPTVHADLAHQIQALQESMPELRSTSAPGPVGTPPQGGPAAQVAGTWALTHRLLALQHTRSSLDQLAKTTTVLEQSIDHDLRATQAGLHPIVGRLHALIGDPRVGGSLADGERVFHDLLERSKLLGAVVLSLRNESALVHRFAADLDAWKGTVERDSRQVLQSLALGLVGVVIAMAAILVGAVLWRVAAVRYVQDAYRRRLVMTARNVVVAAAMALVVVFHFASELTALVTGLGFAAAGIAFALQNVILALAGYFSMVAPNGIRVGDRVSLQGPFGYVQGDVLDIGLVRIRLLELAGEPLRPTGRIVVFPNSVVFTGSFFKHPPVEARADAARRVEPGAAASGVPVQPPR